MDNCEYERINGYRDLEIASINLFTDHLAYTTETLIINVKRAIDAMGRLMKMECEDDVNHQRQEVPSVQGLPHVQHSATRGHPIPVDASH